MNPALRDQPERSASRRSVGNLDLHEMVARDALVLASPREIQIAIVAVAEEFRNVAARVVARVGHRLNRSGHHDGGFWRGDRESLVDEHFGVARMIDHEQRRKIEEVRLPEFCGDAQIVEPITRLQLVPAKLHPVLGHQHVGCRLRVDPQAQRRSPQHVGHEPHRLAVPGEQPGA